MRHRWPLARSPAGDDPVSDGSLTLAAGERLLAYTRTAGGEWLAGTDRALHLAGVQLGWHEVDRVRWAQDTRVLEVVMQPQGAEPSVTHRAELPVPGLLPELVRERVTSSIVVTERVLLAGRASARIIARRSHVGEVRWSVIYDDGVQEDDRLHAAARAAVANLQMRWGT